MDRAAHSHPKSRTAAPQAALISVGGAGEEEEKEGFSRVVHLCTSRVVPEVYSRKRWPEIASKSQPKHAKARERYLFW